MPLDTCSGCFATESVCHFRGLSKHLFLLVDILKFIFTIQAEVILSVWSLQWLKYSCAMSHVSIELKIDIADFPAKIIVCLLALKA
jgi:hypothetical protein